MEMPTSLGTIDAGLRRLLKFLTDTELKSLGAQVGLDEGVDEQRILDATSGLPHYEVVRLFIKAASPTLVMLQQVFDALEVLGVHTRTTGCLFVLANPTKPGQRTELIFSPQAVGMVAVWRINKDCSRVMASLQDLNHRWFTFQPVWGVLLEAAEGKWTDGDIDVVQSCIRQETVYEQEYREDSDAQEVLRYYLNEINAFRSRLETAAQGALPPELESIMSNSRQLLYASSLDQDRRQPETPNERPDEWLLQRYVSHRFMSAFDKFLEDLYLLADLIKGEEILDILRLDIWSSRPQLYEVWVMLSILRWLKSQGYKVQLQAKSASDGIPFKWNLAYSRGSRPCATIFDSKNRSIGHLFYQLYRPSGDMPDISLLKEADVSATPIWSVDPKHSLKRGYGPADYRHTAERYRDSFGAGLSLVVEYFPRPWSNPTNFGNGAKLIVDCNPSGSGLPLLLSELERFHPLMVHWLLCVDFSSSFANRRDSALQALRNRLIASGEDDRLVDEYICFAGNAVRIESMTTWLMGGSLQDPDLQAGTSFDALYEVISSFAEVVKLERVILVTDGEFDIPLEIGKKRLENDLGLDVQLII
jgi:hypothetical protein